MLATIGLVAYVILKMPNPQTKHVRLRSGREVDVVWSGPLNGSKPKWIFEYRTRVPIRDHDRLQHEVEALWHDIENQADQAGLPRAAVWPVSFDTEVRFNGWKPVIFRQLSTQFGFEKNADGVWKQVK